MKKIVIFGAGRVSQLVAHYINAAGIDKVAAFCVDRAYLKDPLVLGLPVIAFEDVEREFTAKDFEMLVVVTFQGISSQWLLRDKSLAAKRKGYRLYTYIDPRASVDKTVVFGENCVVCPQVIIEPFTKIGNGVIVRTGVYVGHDCRIGDYCFLAPRASISGFAKIRPHVFIGNHATIRDRVTVGEEAVVGAGVTVLKDLQPKMILKAPDPFLIPGKRSTIEI